MLAPSEESVRLCTFRLEIEGSWTVEEFQKVLLTIQEVYQRVAATMMLGDLVRGEEARNEALSKRDNGERQSNSWTNIYYGTLRDVSRQRFAEQESLLKILDVVRPFVAPLTIGAIRLESPGWIQLIGNLNPLKVLAEFISKWRAENTKRLQIRIAAETERERLRTMSTFEHERMNRAFALEVLGHMPEGDRRHAAGRLSEIAEHAINPSTAALERLATDARIGEAEIVHPGAPLPTTSRPKPPRSKPPKTRTR